MRLNFLRLLVVFIAFFTCINIISCAINGSKIGPEYDGVDSKLQGYVDEYKRLAKDQGIIFKNGVTIGFKKINQGNAVGMTYYGYTWREIDIDKEYYNKSSYITRWVLLMHELDHAYCTREHDYDGGKYPEKREDRIKEALDWQKRKGPKPGRYEDICPTSIMYPSILDDDCVVAHYNDYIKEMFQRCIPW